MQNLNSLYNWSICALLMLVLAGCISPAPPIVSPEAAVTIPAGATRYRVDPAISTLYIEVYSDGPLARLGHNHLISAPRIEGSLWRHPQLAKSGFALALPVDSLVVDDPAARQQAGADFDRPVSDEARQATRRNMLGSAVLDSTNHPRVNMLSVALENEDGELTVTAALTLRGQRREIGFTAGFEETANRLRIRGTFTFNQSDFAIEPYSVALGALRVADEVRVRFDLTAMAE